MLILRLRRTDDENVGVEGSSTDFSGDRSSGTGMKRSDLVNWYLEEVSDQIESENELIEHKTLIEKIIDRLVYHDQVILILRASDFAKTPSSESSLLVDTDPILVVHPSYSIE